MKRIVFALMLCVGLSAHAQWYTGMSQKTGLALCIHLTDSAAELYSPNAERRPHTRQQLEPRGKQPIARMQ